MVTKRTGKPPTYVCTVDPMSPADAERVHGIREAVRHINRETRHAGVAYRVSDTPRSVKEEFRWKYQNKHSRRVKLEDAERADVYVKLVPRHRGRTKPVARARRRR